MHINYANISLKTGFVTQRKTIRTTAENGTDMLINPLNLDSELEGTTISRDFNALGNTCHKCTSRVINSTEVAIRLEAFRHFVVNLFCSIEAQR